MEAHQGSQAEFTVFIVVQLGQFDVERIAHGTIVSSIVTCNGQKFVSNYQLMEHTQDRGSHVLAGVSASQVHEIQKGLAFLEARGDPVTSHGNDAELMLRCPLCRGRGQHCCIDLPTQASDVHDAGRTES